MSKIAVVYWSGTGNTEKMASEVADGVVSAGSAANVFFVEDFNSSMIEEFDGFAFGCPAMGAEELEDSEFAPVFEDCLDGLTGKKVALFGSYGWGDGDWMRSWEQQCSDAGILLACDSVICNYEPDDEAAEKCRNLGVSLCR